MVAPVFGIRVQAGAVREGLLMAEQWHLDKRVPVSIIGVMVLQTAAFIWLIATMNADIRSNTARTVRLEVMAEERRSQATQNATAIAVINANLAAIDEKLDRIEKKLDEK